MASMRDEILERYPALARRAETSRQAAIALACIECMGGDRGEARRCETKECFLWPFGLAARYQHRMQKGLAEQDEAGEDGEVEPDADDDFIPA